LMMVKMYRKFEMNEQDTKVITLVNKNMVVLMVMNIETNNYMVLNNHSNQN
jgi:hypothetical protein